MNRLAAFLAASVLAVAPLPAAAWGPIGHRITAQIAQDNVSGQTRARIEQILGTEELPEASTWPDEQRSNPDEFWQRTSTPWHFVTLPVGVAPEHLEHPPEGDAATALAHFTAVLRDPAATRDERAMALRFVVHLVTDLHMPLHVGKPGDRGGNDVRVQWFDDPVQRNLHWVWDEGMILHQQLSFTEYAARLDARMTSEQVIAWWEPSPEVWMAESAALRDRLYPETSEELGLGTRESPVRLGYPYNYAWVSEMELRLQQAGIRAAAYLDRVVSAQD
jgi:hypothetical protein